MSKLKPFIAIGIIILIGVIAILFTDPTGDVYNQYLSLDNTSGKGYDSKGKFTKQFEYHNEQLANDNKNKQVQSNGNSQAGTIDNSDKDNYIWSCTYSDYSGNIVTYDGVTYKAGEKGPAMPLMLQGGSDWSTYWPTGLKGGTNIAASGCGYTSLAACITYLTGQNITPQRVLEDGAGKFHTTSSGIGWDAFTAVPTWYGCNVIDIGHDITRLAEELKSGKVACASVGTTDDSMNTFSKGAHIIAIRGVTEEGNFLVNNPNGRGETQLNVEYTPEQMQSLIKHEWVIGKN